MLERYQWHETGMWKDGDAEKRDEEPKRMWVRADEAQAEIERLRKMLREETASHDTARQLQINAEKRVQRLTKRLEEVMSERDDAVARVNEINDLPETRRRLKMRDFGKLKGRIHVLRETIEDAARVLESGTEPFCSQVPEQLRESLAEDTKAADATAN